MTVEIKELVIKASITGKSGTAAHGTEQSPDTDRIVSECVAQVLKILERNKER